MFESFYKSYRLYVRDLCRKRFSNEEHAKDLESVVWVEVYDLFERFCHGDPRRLLYQLVSWRARDLYRQHYRLAAHESPEDLEDASLARFLVEIQALSCSVETKLALKHALQREDLEDRQILFGRFIEGMAWEELSVRHELHRNTLLKRVKSSLQRLRHEMEGHSLLEQRT